MQCQSCGDHEANIHLSHVLDGVAREIHLCEECAEQNGMNIREAMSLSDFLLGLGTIEQGRPGMKERACPSCGVTSSDVRKGSRMGCAVCYDTFKAELGTILSSMHKHDEHKGKQPVGGAESEAPQVAMLRKELEAAIAAEDYEKAAKLRDRILLMKAGGEPCR